MTRKEKIYAEYLHVLNDYNLAHGKYPIACDDAFFATDIFKYQAKESGTIEHLQQQMKFMRSSITRKLEEKRAEEFFNTEDGAKYFAYLTDKQEQVYEQIKSNRNAAQNEIIAIVQSVLGDKWTAVFNTSRTEIGMIDNEKGGFIFGHEFSLFYDAYDAYDIVNLKTKDISDFVIKFSNGTMMGFDAFNDETRREHIIGMGKFLQDVDALAKIRKVIYNASVKDNQLKEERDKISDKIKKPTQEDLDAWLNEQNNK